MGPAGAGAGRAISQMMRLPGKAAPRNKAGKMSAHQVSCNRLSICYEALGKSVHPFGLCFSISDKKVWARKQREEGMEL